MKNNNPDKNKAVVYYMSEAADFIHKNISEKTRSKYSLKNILYILDLLDDYFDIIGINVYEGEDTQMDDHSVEVDENLLRDYIIKRAAQNNLFIEEKELIEILNAEIMYSQHIGAIEDQGEN